MAELIPLITAIGSAVAAWIVAGARYRGAVADAKKRASEAELDSITAAERANGLLSRQLTAAIEAAERANAQAEKANARTEETIAQLDLANHKIDEMKAEIERLQRAIEALTRQLAAYESAS